MRPGDDLEFVPKGSDIVVELRRRRSVLEFAGLAANAAARVPDDADALDALIESGLAATAVRRTRSIGPR